MGFLIFRKKGSFFLPKGNVDQDKPRPEVHVGRNLPSDLKATRWAWIRSFPGAVGYRVYRVLNGLGFRVCLGFRDLDVGFIVLIVFGVWGYRVDRVDRVLG